MTPDLRVFPGVSEMSHAAAEATVRTIGDAIRATGRCSLVLAGGSTPGTMYRLLAEQFRDRIAWEHVHVFWGDERYVPADHPQSNYRMARLALLDHVACPPENVHPMPTHLATPDLAARDYERTLRNFLADDQPRFDLVLLGLGDDGHTASLFPASPALAERARWVSAVETQALPPTRLTLTFPALNGAAAVYFLVAGPGKAHALQQVLAPAVDVNAYPAAGVRPEAGTVTWWVDRDAASARSGAGRTP